MPTILDLIGHTPLVEVTRLDTGPCRLFLKLESQNPSGSIKDRPARAMIEAAEYEGRLKPGGTVIEATAGNTGLGLAFVGARKGYRTILVVPDKMSREKILHARAMGAEIIVTRSDVGKGHPDYYQDLAADLTARTKGAIYINQFENPANPRAHEETTAPEILDPDGARHRRHRGRRRLRRHADRHRALHVPVFAEDADGAGRPRRLDPRALCQDRRDEPGRKLGGGGDRRGFHPAQLRSLAGEGGLFDFRPRQLRGRARIDAAGGHSRGLFLRHAAGGGACAIAARRASPNAW